MLTLGQIVFSKCGHDKGKAFLVVDLGDGYCYLADGASRPLAKPKRKKERHVQPTNTIDGWVRQALQDHGPLLDADLRKALASYQASISMQRAVGQEA